MSLRLSVWGKDLGAGVGDMAAGDDTVEECPLPLGVPLREEAKTGLRLLDETKTCTGRCCTGVELGAFEKDSNVLLCCSA